MNRTQDGFGAGIEGGKSGSGARLSTVPDSGRLSRVPQDEFIGFIIKRGSQYPPRFIIYLLVSSNVRTRVFTPALFAPVLIFLEFQFQLLFISKLYDVSFRAKDSKARGMIDERDDTFSFEASKNNEKRGLFKR